VVLTLTIRPGDRIELLSAEPVGVGDAATVSFLLSRPVFHPNGDSVIGEEVETVNGAQLASVSASPGPANEVGIVAEATAVRPGRYELTSVRLRYRLNGGAEQVGDGIDVTWTICVDDPAPTTCSG